MELKNYYRLVFTNQQEFFIESETAEIATFKKELANTGLLGSQSDYIVLQLKDGDPLHIRADKLFSVQKAREGIVGSQTKLWRLA